MLLEQVVDFLGVPALIAKLENVTMSRRQDIKKVGQTIRVTTPAWRQLKQNRPQPVFESLSAGKEFFRRSLWRLQLLHVGDEPAALAGEGEFSRHGFTPRL